MSDIALLQEALTAIEKHQASSFNSDHPALEQVRKKLHARLTGGTDARAMSDGAEQAVEVQPDFAREGQGR